MKTSLAKVSIILPTYNEAENIIPLIKDIQKTVKAKTEIIVVDDNSPDGTSKIVSQFIKKKKLKDLKLETRFTNRGLTNSIKRGIELAQGDTVVWLDCDFSMPPFVINNLLQKINEGYDIAVGSRFVRGGKFKHPQKGKKDSWVAVVLSRLMNYTIQFLLMSSFKDYTSGFVAVKKKVFEKVKLRGDYGEYFIDFIFKSSCYKFKIIEVPYVCMPREKGESKTGSNIFQYLKRGRKYIQLTLTLLLEKHISKTLP